MNPVRFSHLRAYGRCGLHGHHARAATEDEQTYAIERGTAVHALLFGNKKVCGYSGPVRRGKEYEAFAAAHANHEILTTAEYDKARRMAEAVMANELAQQVLKGVSEKTLLFRWMGQNCRSTPDVRGADYITELKTTANADPDKFRWHSLRMKYHAQMRFEQIACGRSAKDAYLVAVESMPPFPVSVFRFTPRALEDGEKQLVLWMERLIVCESSAEFPPYCSSIVDLDVPDLAEVEYEGPGKNDLAAEDVELMNELASQP